jgi:hypothetical protein
MGIPVLAPLWRGLTVAVLAVVAIGCISGGGHRAPTVSAPAPPGDGSVSSPLEGEWRLTSLQLADGATRRVTGFLRFDRFSNISLHAELAADEPAARPPRTVVADFTAKAQPGGTEFAYSGLTMGVGPERLTDDAVTMAEWRHYELAGDTLRVFARDRAGRPAATLVFERTR